MNSILGEPNKGKSFFTEEPLQTGAEEITELEILMK